MELYRLPVDEWMQARRDPVDTGWTRAIRHGPMTVEQVLGRAVQEMLDEDERERLRAGPVVFAPAGPRRRTLLGRLFSR
jgi:hypothetical protein